MLKIIIVEDEKTAKESLEGYIRLYAENKGVQYDLTWYDNPVNFLTEYKSDADIVFLDVKMPDMDGLRCARDLRKMDTKVMLIFVTNMAQYAVKGYEVEAADFIVKPVSYYDFAMKMDRVLKKISLNNEAQISFKSNGVLKRVTLKDVYYIEVEGHNLVFHTVDGPVETRSTLKNFEETLLENNFFRCSNCCMVNLRYVSAVEGYTVTLAMGGGDSVPITISRLRKKEFIHALNIYFKGYF